MTGSFIPPLAISRMIGAYHFEGGGYVALVADGNVPTELIIEKAQALLDLKREELASVDARPKDGDSTQIEAPLASSAVANGETPKRRPHSTRSQVNAG